MIALTATVTKAMRIDICQKLEMSSYRYINVSPDRANIYYEVFTRSDMKEDLFSLVSELQASGVEMPRTIVY